MAESRRQIEIEYECDISIGTLFGNTIKAGEDIEARLKKPPSPA